MRILQRLLDRISPTSASEEERKNEEYEERRQRRLIKIRAEVDAEVEVPNADDLGRWLGFSEGEDGDDAR